MFFLSFGLFQSPAFIKIKNEYKNRLNKLYTHPLLGDLLDNGEIDFAILNILEELYKVSKNRQNALNSNYNDYSREQIRNNPIF